MLIDCDVHITPETVREIADYTDSATRDLLVHSGTEGLCLPDYPWYHPTGWVRKDAYDPASDDPGMHTIDLAKVRAQVLDAHDVTFGIGRGRARPMQSLSRPGGACSHPCGGTALRTRTS